MAKFSIHLIFVLGALVSFTLGATTVNPLSPFLNPASYSPEKQCPTVCASECAVTSMTCIDIPGFVDCAATNSQCSGQCNQLCACLSDCSTQCTSSYKCDQNTDQAMTQIVCHAQRLVCSSVCQMNCPGTLLSQSLAPLIQSTMNQVAALLTHPVLPNPDMK